MSVHRLSAYRLDLFLFLFFLPQLRIFGSGCNAIFNDECYESPNRKPASVEETRRRGGDIYRRLQHQPRRLCRD
ncbi:hypothetical protein B0J18DRAFT_439636 [Chaetomium sp. MPI-SDFR-AT-0129]|nr:hypothetical protein B0J18DRAFT_439636 [Chaetomium sp. MPI-SDFR-AT-0129]